MAHRSCIALLLALLLATVTADHHTIHSDENPGDHAGLHSSQEDNDQVVHTLPFEIKKYEATMQEGQVTLTLYYVALAPFPATWVVANNDIGVDVAEMTNARTWSQCVEDNHEHWVCSSTLQTSMLRVLRRLSVELLYSSENTVLRYNGFSEEVLPHGPAARTAGSKEYLAAPFVVREHPALKTHFTLGEDVTLRWDIDSDNPHELALVKRKAGNLFTDQVLHHHGDEDDHEDSSSTTEGNVVTTVTVTKTTGNMYNYVIEVVIGSVTADDTGVYVVRTRGGMENWVEVLPTLEESAYPSTPVLHIERLVMSTFFGIFCSAEGHDITDIQLLFNDVVIEETANERIAYGSRTDDARAVGYKGIPTEDKSWTDFSGTYTCQVTQESGQQTAHPEEYTFTDPDKK